MRKAAARPCPGQAEKGVVLRYRRHDEPHLFQPGREHSGDLSDAITAGKRIIITTIEKFPFALPKIGAEHKDNRFAIIIDEAHSGQSGRNSALTKRHENGFSEPVAR